MRKSERQAIDAIKTQLTMKEEIRERFGEKAIQKAKRRLCAKCGLLNCSLLPITTKGEDCPYFKPREVKE